MQCADFETRLHHLLDEHRSVEDDVDLERHAVDCPECRSKRRVWCGIASVLNTTCDPSAEVDATASPSIPDRASVRGSRQSASRQPSLFAVALSTAAIFLLLLVRPGSDRFESAQSVELEGRVNWLQASRQAIADSNLPEESIDGMRQRGPEANDLAGDSRHVPATGSPPHRSVQQNAHLDPASWWDDVQPVHWMNQTMPTVRSMKQGVAPIGRTLVGAVTLLTVGGGTHTS